MLEYGNAQLPVGVVTIFSLEIVGTNNGYRWKKISKTSGQSDWRSVRLHLVPFNADDLRAVRDWEGFYIYEIVTATDLDKFWRELTAKFDERLKGNNYWARKFPNGEFEFDEPFAPAYLREFRTYVGLTERPRAWQ